MIHVSQCCILGRIIRIGGTLIDPSVWWEGFVALEWESICTSYSRETAKQEVIYSWRSVLMCRAVSSCDATPSFPRKLWSPLWEEAGGRNTTMFSGFILPKDSAQPREMSSALTHPKAGETKSCGRGCWPGEASLPKLLLRVGNNTVRRGLTKRQRALVTLLHRSSLAESGVLAHKTGFSRASLLFHSRANSPFQQRSNRKNEIRIEIFNAKQGEKEPQFTSCYELRMWYIPVLLLTTICGRDAQDVDLFLLSSTNSYSHKILTAVHRSIAWKWLEWKTNFLQTHLIQHFHHLYFVQFHLIFDDNWNCLRGFISSG